MSKANVRLKSAAYPRIASRLFDTPLMIHEAKLQAILSVLGPRLGFGSQAANVEFSAELNDFETKYTEAGYAVRDGIAIIEVMGPTIHHYDFISEACGFTSYETLGVLLQRALDDSGVKRIVMRIDSPGGEVAGLFDFCERIYQARSIKPITAVLDDCAASAAYMIACSCSEIVVPDTGYTGSIGVVMTHVDVSKQLQANGIAVTYLFAGDRKVDGWPAIPLSDEAREEIQSKINALYDKFTTTVARNRGIDVKDVVGTQARLFLGQQGIDAGLADRIGTFHSELAALGSEEDEPLRPIIQPLEETEMSDATKKDGGATASVEDINKARGEGHAEGKAAGVEEGKKAGAAAFKERLSAVRALPEAEGRTEMADHLAMNTEMSVDQIKATLAITPKPAAPAAAAPAAAAPAKNPLEAAMEDHAAPSAGSDGGNGGDADEVGTAAENILSFTQGHRRAAASKK